MLIVRKRKTTKLTPRVVYEDDFLLVIDKPAGLVTSREPSISVPTLEDWLKQKFSYPMLFDAADHAGLAHRLDKETSGLILVGKSRSALESLRCQFKERRIRKKYLALVSGEVTPPKAVIDLPIGRSALDRKKFGITPEGRPSRTEYEVKKRYRDNRSRPYCLLELSPQTGRTHQLRVHLRAMNYPIVGDIRYGGKKAAKERRWCPRQFLHAYALGLRHPESDKPKKFTTPMPADLVTCLASLKLRS